ncbi:antiviral reverse transcriptase Drt3a [Nocardiopsis sp. HUAS JQ3]|uniref:antiviral reverse transcriptase Drt3a n=1 Tax=Nocardiopsis sp. HUAS JQ3 TaxID=3061629 RepID=UPI0023AA0055|nr:antiviral reverse transcriptase Drt3a [Nocardiopsis sp. HUAS JQ3]WDZ91091.1 RNA-directed DNA polymerase [Nocardiopsis sp. HUAS JQ3]
MSFDQSFSSRNMRRVWELQTRKGINLADFFGEVKKKQYLLREYRKQILDGKKKGKYSSEQVKKAYKWIAEQKSDLDKEINKALEQTSEKLASLLTSQTFAWGLRYEGDREGRPLYGIERTPEVYFADKQLQRNVSSATASQQNSRSSAISGLAQALNNDMPKMVVRTDIRSFYESISHDLLFDSMSRSSLSSTSRYLVEGLINEYAQITGRDVGLPMGVGVSSQLSELFISQIDPLFKVQENVIYYARYVDDIVLVLGRDANEKIVEPAELRGMKSVLSEMNLSISENKTGWTSFPTAGKSTVDFLGYTISKEQKKGLKICLSARRERLILERLNRSFSAWEKYGPDNHGRRRLLIDRIKFLTGNTRLVNNKRNAMVGIYFSNPHLTDFEALERLDKHLRSCMQQYNLPPDLRQKIEHMSFEKGFKERLFNRFSRKQLKEMKGAWNA